ncbi:MAG: phosphoenolpyruvate carboxykinase (GTP) [bacterium]
MTEKLITLLETKCTQENLDKLIALKNPVLMEFIATYAELCNPRSIFVRTDAAEEARYIADKAQEQKEEIPLAINGHTAHFDGYFDQGRDKANTRFLMYDDLKIGPDMNSTDREEGLQEIKGFLKNSMAGKDMYVLFLCLGPVDSEFSIYGVQITDSAYVAHAEDILYRPAYNVFKKKGSDIEFFKYVHSAGEIENQVSRNADQRRVYIDCKENVVYTVNTQYAGNTLGLKKLSLRLVIRKSDKERWLSEHMFVMGVHGPNNRKTYFTGAFPSACGKTSTCMVDGERIVGDDIAYLRNRDGKTYAVNVERGIFGIIKDVNTKDDPLIWKSLTTPGEVIFSNILVKNGVPYWQGSDQEIPEEGENYSGKWFKDKCDEKGKPIAFSHSNARYTIKLDTLENCDPELENPMGVHVQGIIYGGRDSDTWPPVFQSFNWKHGVITIASSLESETTSATLGKEGVRKFNLMANLDFLSIPAGQYIQNHLNFIRTLKTPPVIFGVNYFLKDKKGAYLNTMHDKRVWLKWMDLRVHNEVDAVKTPIGFIPQYNELKRLFSQVLNKNYSRAEYNENFKFRIQENISKIQRIIDIYKEKVSDVPGELFTTLNEQKKRLEEARAKYGDYILPDTF